MKPLLCGLFLATLATFAFANYGHYVPKAAFTVDENGGLLHYFPLHPATMNRFRRSAQVSSSSASASSSSTGNSPIYFGNPYGGGGFGPGFGAPFGHQRPFAPAPGTVYSGTSSTSSVSSNPNGGLHSRFGGDEPPARVQGSTSSITSQNGQFTHTQSHLGEDGKVHFTVSSGKF